ncbi:MAG TPA: response regulator transcription factor, partial [Planctomycetaceae bacterium]|nr:response regulator transcription factor [Planctomycetaceae bacterium]
MKAIRILLADDHALFRSGLRALLEKMGDVSVVAEAADGREALQQIKTVQPDIAMLDISMPGLNGLEVARQTAEDAPAVRVLILSMHSSEQYVVRALRAGAAGYLLKDADIDELERAVRAVARGQTYLDSRVAGAVAEFVRETAGESELDRLTPRQREILQLIAEGNSTKQIAQLLHVSVKTVETHRAQLMDRLGIYDVAGLVRFAIRAG